MSDGAYGIDAGVGAVLPENLRHLLDGTQLQALPGFTLALLSVDEVGRVHTSLLSLAEVLAPPPLVGAADSLHLALWPSARAVAHLERTRRGALTGVADARLFQIQLSAVERLADLCGLACFTAQVERVETQQVAYAQLQSGITFKLSAQASEVEARWAAQLAALRAL